MSIGVEVITKTKTTTKSIQFALHYIKLISDHEEDKINTSFCSLDVAFLVHKPYISKYIFFPMGHSQLLLGHPSLQQGPFTKNFQTHCKNIYEL